MPEYQDNIQKLNEAKQQYNSTYADYLQSREQLNKIRNQREQLLRKANPNDDGYLQKIERLDALEKSANASFDANLLSFTSAKKSFGSIYANFALSADPRQMIEKKNDNTPFLLFPVRIETRFKKVSIRDRILDELWIRIFPDDCLVDTFEEMLSETEVSNAATYWQQQWEAGGNEDQEKGAWRMLAGNHGSGRASYILEQYKPLNSADAPIKTNKQDVVLVVSSSQLPSDTERLALDSYWKTIWTFMGDANKEQEAFDRLTTDVGSANTARNLLQIFTPFNLATIPLSPFKKEEIAVLVVFLQLPDADTVPTKSQSWSKAPSVNSLPEQFVVIGYEGDTVAFEQLLSPIPSPLFVAPDPGLKEEDQFSKDSNGDIIFPDELKWMTDFSAAIQNGLGVKIPITAAQATLGFSRLVVLGIRLSTDATKGKELVENLFDHHRKSRKGIALLQQGTPTNNTESDSSGYSYVDDPDESFMALKKGKLFEQETDWKKRKDGQWLAECLGISYDSVNKISNSDLTDQAEARMMNTVLWPATQGYMMETLMQPVFQESDIANTRNFFTEFVNGRGRVPAIKIGKQPYGILPTTDFGNIKWFRPRFEIANSTNYLQKLYTLLKQMDEDWKPLLKNVSYIGKPGDAHQILLDALGLTPASIEFYQRTAESKEDIFNRYNMLGLGGLIVALFLSAGYVQSGIDLLKKFGYADNAIPDILNKFFLTSQNLLKGDLIDDRPLSETNKIRSYTTDDKNYIQWLINATQTSHDTLRKQQGFVDSKIPTALLYLVMHHALDLSYIEVSLKLFEKVNLLTSQQVVAAKLEPAFFHIQSANKSSESKWSYLYQKQPAITGSTDLLVGDYIPKIIKTEIASQYMKQQLEAMEYLKDVPTARLERLFAEHLDCCSYRLDAWKSGLMNYQLAAMRGMQQDSHTGNEDAQLRSGIHIGAFGWVENVKSENKVLTPVVLDDQELKQMFIDGQEIPLMRDSKNGGHITAPSLDQALTAAILRNGYTSNGNPDTLRINLSSERVRKALSAIEGIRQGQTLGALLGYYFERGLHEEHPGVELDYYIYQLRKAFPLTVNRIKDTAVNDADSNSVETIEARNVVDGLSLIDQVVKTGITGYPFGKTNLPPLDHPATQGPAISKELDKIRDINDAVADLAISESVYQAVLANYERSNATLDTFSKGNFPPTPEVIQTPRSGTNLTHRVGLHLKPALPSNPLFTPRANAEPAINDWVQTMLPSINNIICAVSYGLVVDEEVSAANLGLCPLDLLYLINTDSDQALKEIDDRILKFVMEKPGVRPDANITINYMKQVAGKYSFFEMASYVHSLQSILLHSRPLTPNDVSIAIEAKQQEDTIVFSDINQVRLGKAHDALKQILDNDLSNYIATLTPMMSDTVANHDAILAAIDTGVITPIIPILYKLSFYGIPQTGFGFIYQTQKEIFSSMLSKIATLTTKWEDRLAKFDQAMIDYTTLPLTTLDIQKIQFLQSAELFISPLVRTTVPAIPDDYRDLLVTTGRIDFVATINKFTTIASTKNTTLTGLLQEIKALTGSIASIDGDAFSMEENETQFIIFSEEVYTKAHLLLNDLKSRLANAKAKLDSLDDFSESAKKVSIVNEIAKTIFHEDFKIVPEFGLVATGGTEWSNAYNDTNQLLAYATQPNGDGVSLHDFPVDDWLYGAARVREKLHHWENITLLADAFKKQSPELHPIQLPYKALDTWLALEFPQEYSIAGDRLLYTAHYATSFNKDARQCGLLIDEWTEIIPSKEENIGVTFHYDRPNSEPPQAILLAMPTEFTGSWKWQDLLNTVNETLNMAKRRAIEPAHIDTTSYARFLPALVSSMTVHPLSASLNFAFNNKIHEILLNRQS